MERLSSYAVDPVSAQLALLNLLLFVHLVCKGVEYATRVFMRRDPPKKSIRSKLARSDES
ncbi:MULTISPECIES: hypothetical protein [Burkholderia cepacia complex]|uniref:Transposase n=1 Tax=Burkholderia ubonensis TaxID=101571 RepID=A0ABD6Q9Q0_9BURK|nr:MULTISPECIES: hypothetical protein [Burkholderia cepacia complex]HEJ2441580.1 hypothetical protein [Burkholderia multivorans]AOI69775.1 hypothetical protein WI31_09470 [Burkholderia ubonensis]KUZ15634.1 hypothetical protein WI29_21220 [Burkholderia ubonensis]KUZ25397.1 hypothetical protein WI30_28895 [Burkholderia ubonensis]KUZ32214.1 hypothetical protein WI32_22970 [Burkholderia ubonensis]